MVSDWGKGWRGVESARISPVSLRFEFRTWRHMFLLIIEPLLLRENCDVAFFFPYFLSLYYFKQSSQIQALVKTN